MISADNHLVGSFLYTVALEGDCEITVPLDINAKNLESF
jgi:hypothetical protein